MHFSLLRICYYAGCHTAPYPRERFDNRGLRRDCSGELGRGTGLNLTVISKARIRSKIGVLITRNKKVYSERSIGPSRCRVNSGITARGKIAQVIQNTGEIDDFWLSSGIDEQQNRGLTLLVSGSARTPSFCR